VTDAGKRADVVPRNGCFLGDVRPAAEGSKMNVRLGPTVKLVPLGRDWLLVAISVPLKTLVPPP